MKTTELQELFANAKNAQDVIAIFEANPGLEDEILALGKKQGINLDEPRELSDLELELVVGGLNLKKGVIITMSTLMLAGSLTGPLVRTAHAAPAGEEKPAAVQVVENGSDTGEAINPPAPDSSDNTEKTVTQNKDNTTDSSPQMETVESRGHFI